MLHVSVQPALWHLGGNGTKYIHLQLQCLLSLLKSKGIKNNGKLNIKFDISLSTQIIRSGCTKASD